MELDCLLNENLTRVFVGRPSEVADYVSRYMIPRDWSVYIGETNERLTIEEYEIRKEINPDGSIQSGVSQEGQGS